MTERVMPNNLEEVRREVGALRLNYGTGKIGINDYVTQACGLSARRQDIARGGGREVFNGLLAVSVGEGRKAMTLGQNGWFELVRPQDRVDAIIDYCNTMDAAFPPPPAESEITGHLAYPPLLHRTLGGAANRSHRDHLRFQLDDMEEAEASIGFKGVFLAELLRQNVRDRIREVVENKILNENVSARPNQEKDFWRAQLVGELDPRAFEADAPGLSFCRSYLGRLTELSGAKAIEIWGDQFKDALKILRAVAFMKTSHHKSGEIPLKTIRVPIIRSLEQGVSSESRVMEAREVLRYWIMERPDLFSDSTLRDLGLTRQSVEAELARRQQLRIWDNSEARYSTLLARSKIRFEAADMVSAGLLGHVLQESDNPRERFMIDYRLGEEADFRTRRLFNDNPTEMVPYTHDGLAIAQGLASGKYVDLGERRDLYPKRTWTRTHKGNVYWELTESWDPRSYRQSEAEGRASIAWKIRSKGFVGFDGFETVLEAARDLGAISFRQFQDTIAAKEMIAERIGEFLKKGIAVLPQGQVQVLTGADFYKGYYKGELSRTGGIAYRVFDARKFMPIDVEQNDDAFVYMIPPQTRETMKQINLGPGNAGAPFTIHVGEIKGGAAAVNSLIEYLEKKITLQNLQTAVEPRFLAKQAMAELFVR